MTDSYIALDLETTGLEPKKEKITEIAALKVEHGQITGRFVTLVNPKRPLTERVVELTGITDDMLKDAPVIEDIIGEVLEFIGNLPLLGHNIRFDYSFLKQAAVNQKMEFECEAVDTLKVCRKLMPEQEKKNLGNACTYYKIEQPLAHRAEADALSAHFLYQKLVALYGEEQPELFVTTPLNCRMKRQQPATKRAIWSLRPRGSSRSHRIRGLRFALFTREMLPTACRTRQERLYAIRREITARSKRNLPLFVRKPDTS